MSTTATFVEQPETQSQLSRDVPNENRGPIQTIDELIKRRALELEDVPLLGCPKEGILDFEDHSARAVDRYVDAAILKLQELGFISVDPSTESPPVIGILAHSGLHVVITIMALSRLGFTVFLISTRLASPALGQLLEMANCSTVLTTEHFHPVLAEVQQVRRLELRTLISHSDYYGKTAPVFSRSYDAQIETNKIAVIIHSSGSTGLPKPIYLSHRSCIAAFATNMNMRALIASPMFHSHGFYETFRSIYSGKPIYYCNYSFPLTRQSLTDMINVVKPDLFHAVPYMIKLLAESTQGVDALARVKLVLSGGSACPDDLGTKLVARGVNLVANYGATETGRLMNSDRPAGDMDWNYLRLLPVAKPFVLMDEIAPNLYECVALDGLKSKSTINSDNPPRSFRTRDLFTPHPTREGLWKYASRLDDRFTLINGEKVLPIPIEGRIRQEEIVREACVFGEGRSFPGLLVVRADRASSVSDDEFIERLWPAVEDANSKAEAFSRIPRELIVVLPSDSHYPHTDKGTFIRVPFYEQFADAIDAAYDSFEGDKGGVLSLEGEELEHFLLQTIKTKIGIEMSVDTDFFAAGIDSLQCVQIWNAIKQNLDLGGRQADLSQNVLYETGNIKNLAAHLHALRLGKDPAARDDCVRMEELIEKYSTFEPHRGDQNLVPEKEVVLLTGVTGGLGAHTLAQLVERPNVAAVWAFVRAPSPDAAAQRVQSSLQSRDIELAPEHKAKIIALPCDLGRSDLGLEASRLSHLRNSLTCVVHSAWAVNFNILVQSFEGQHIKGTHNLIQLCLSVPASRPARFYFCSSVSSAGASPRPGTVPEGQVSSPVYAQGTGYARSKYVTEHITYNAAKNYGMSARVLRVGQLVGDSKVGEWNATEGIPMMIQTAITLGSLPALDEEMTWLPVDYAASVVLELSGLASPIGTAQGVCSPQSNPDLVYHVLNPTLFHWSNQMLPALAEAGLRFDTLPTNQWMEKLRNSDRDPAKNPPIKLLEWFESKYGTPKGALKTETLKYLTDRSVIDSPTLGTVPDVTNVHFVRKMLLRLQKRWSGQGYSG